MDELKDRTTAEWTILRSVCLGLLLAALVQTGGTAPGSVGDGSVELQPLTLTRDGNKAFTLSGILYNKEGKPAAGATVRFYENQRAEPSKPVVTANDGSFELKGKEIFCFLAQSSDGQDLFLHFVGKEMPVAQLQAAEKLTGSVKDQDGQPVAGATVGFYTQQRRNFFAESNDKGEFTILYPQDTPPILSIFAFKSKKGFDYRLFGSEDANETPSVEVDWSKPFALTLTGAEPIRLNVRWDDGSPAAGVKVTPWIFQNPALPKIITQGPFSDPSFNFAYLQYFNRRVVGADGIVEFDWMPNWLERITFFYLLGPWGREDGDGGDDGDEPLKRFEVDFKPPTNDSHEKTIVLYRPRKVAGIVRYPDGTPAEGITIKYEGNNLTYDYKQGSAKTNADGRYEMDIEAEAAYILAVVNKDWAAPAYNPLVINAKTPPEELQSLDFTLQKPSRVYGKALSGHEKKPLAGSKIYFSMTGKTDLTLPPEKQLTSDRQRTINEGCAPDLRYSFTRETTIDTEGNFSINLGPGEYEVNIMESYIGMPNFVHNLLPDKTLVIAPDAPAEIVFNLDAEPTKRGNLQGQVLLSDGKPAAGIKLVGVYWDPKFPNQTSPAPEFSAETDAEGKFSAPRTLEKMYLYAKTADGKQQAMLTLEPAQTLDKPFMLKPSGWAAGRIVDMKGNPMPGVEFTYGVVLHELSDGDDWFDARRNLPQRIRNSLRFGGTGKSDAEGNFHIDSVLADQDFYVAYRAAKEFRYNTDDVFQLAKFRIEKPGETQQLGDCRVNPIALDGWKAADAATLQKFTARFVDDKTGKPIANQEIGIQWALWTAEDRKKVEDFTKEFEKLHKELEEKAKKELAEGGELKEGGALEPSEELKEGVVALFLRLDSASSSRDFDPSRRAFTGAEPSTDADGKVEFSYPTEATVYDPNDVCLIVECFYSGQGREYWYRIPYMSFRETIQGPFESAQDFTFRLTPFDPITGKVVDPEGKPVKGATLFIQTTTSVPGITSWTGGCIAHKEMEVVTDAAGMFQAMTAPDFNQGTVQCNPPGFVPFQLDLQDREITDWTFTVQKGTDVTGRVVDTAGNGIPDVWVNFERRRFYMVYNEQLGRSVKTDKEGRFTVPSLGKEEYLVLVTALPSSQNAENVKLQRGGTSSDNFKMVEKYVFSNSVVDLRGEEPPKPLTIIGHSTVALQVVVRDETPKKSAISYSNFSFSGQFADEQEGWNIRFEGAYDPQTRASKSGTVNLPKGVPLSLTGRLIGSVVRDGVTTLSPDKPDWTLEYRFGTGDWQACEETQAMEAENPVNSPYRWFSVLLEALTGNEEPLEIRVR